MPDASAALESARACSLGPAVLCSVKAMHDQRRTGANRRSILDTGALLRMGARRFGICIQKCACQGTTLLCGAAVCTLTAPCPCKKPSPKARSNRKRAHCPLPSAVCLSPFLLASELSPFRPLHSLLCPSAALHLIRPACLDTYPTPPNHRELLSARQSRRSTCEKSTAHTTTRRNSLCIAPSSASASASVEFTHPHHARAYLTIAPAVLSETR